MEGVAAIMHESRDKTNSRTNLTRKVNTHVSVDCVIFGFKDSNLEVLVIERKVPVPLGGEGALALPGNLIFEDEDLDQAAERVLKELTNLDEIFLEQFKSFGNPNRLDKKEDQEWLKFIRTVPEARVITVAYYALIQIDKYQPSAAGFATQTRWIPISDIPNLAFDHNEICEEALKQLRSQVYRRPLVFELLPEMFSLAELQSVYEVITQASLDKRNFRRKILGTGFIKETSQKQIGVAHKPAQLYRFDEDLFEKSEGSFVSF